MSLATHQAENLSKGISTADARQIVRGAAVLESRTMLFGGKSYRAQRFNIDAGTKMQMTVVCTPRCMPVWERVSATDSFLLVFDDKTDQLLAWGTISELSRGQDTTVAEVAQQFAKAN